MPRKRGGSHGLFTVQKLTAAIKLAEETDTSKPAPGTKSVLKKRVDELTAELQAQRERVEKLAKPYRRMVTGQIIETNTGFMCEWCSAEADTLDNLKHYEECPAELAKAALVELPQKEVE